MDFALTEEQEMIRDAAREFAQKEIAPVAARYDESGEFPSETIAMAGQLGFMGIEVPEEYGGAGLDAVGYALVMEEIAAADAAHSTIVSVNNSLYSNGILDNGNEEQKQKYVRPVASGEVVGAYALTEPQSGSDAGNMRTRAVLAADGSHYVINGKKSWITSGPVARFIVVFAMTDPEQGPRGVSAFIIDTERDGFACGKTEPKLGIRASATCEIEFDGYRCPVEDRLGPEGAGFKIAMGVLDAGRIGIAAQAVGIAARRLRGQPRLRSRAQGLWRTDRQLPDDPGQDRGHEDASEARPSAHAAGRVEQEPGQSRRATQYHRGVAAPSSLPPRRRCLSPTRRCRSMAAWVTAVRCRWSAISAMPRSPKSTRAPAKSSAW